MKKGKKIAVGLAAALVVAMIAAGAVSMVGAQLPVPITFTVTVSGIDVSIEEVDTSFGAMLPGATKNLTPSFRLTNDGNLDAGVNASFTTHDGLTFGLTGGSVINATYFKINDESLNDDGSDKQVTTASKEDTTDYNTRLYLPLLQEAAAYTGTVELTFSPILPA